MKDMVPGTVWNSQWYLGMTAAMTQICPLYGYLLFNF